MNPPRSDSPSAPDGGGPSPEDPVPKGPFPEDPFEDPFPDDAASPVHGGEPAQRPGAGRSARSSRDRLTIAAGVALSTGLLLGGGGWALASRGAGCDGPGAWVSVTADPAIAPAALAAADRFNGARRAAGECAAVKVVAGDSGEVAGVFRGGRGTPDVWIPDSSLWPDLVRRATAGRAPSVASSPIVFALPEDAGNRRRSELARRSFEAFRPDGTAGGPPFLLRLPDPARTGTGMATLLALQASSGSGRDALGRFTTMLRTAKTLPPGKGVVDAAFAEAGAGGGAGAEGTAVLAVSEQAAWQHDESAPRGSRVTTVYPSAGTPYLDFPFVVATSEGARERVARRFLDELRSPRTAADLRRAGLRGAPASGGRAAAPRAGTAPLGATGTAPLGGGTGRGAPRVLPVVRPGAAAGIQETWRKLGQGLNVLAVVDPSGAGAPMPARSGAHGTRLEAMVKALSTGFSLVPDDSAFGLWTLTGAAGRPYRQVQPIRELGMRTRDGANHRFRLQRALSEVRPPEARPGPRPGLYAAIRSAYAEVGRTYGAGKLNIVLVLTAGGPRGREGGEFDRTVRELRGAFDARRPVSVVVLGFGADAAPTLRGVAAVTDGGTYEIDEPDMVMRLFLRSDQLRVCDAPACPG